MLSLLVRTFAQCNRSQKGLSVVIGFAGAGPADYGRLYVNTSIAEIALI